MKGGEPLQDLILFLKDSVVLRYIRFQIYVNGEPASVLMQSMKGALVESAAILDLMRRREPMGSWTLGDIASLMPAL